MRKEKSESRLLTSVDRGEGGGGKMWESHFSFLS